MEELYRTVKEQVKPIEAVVEGEIPTWLNGSLLRNGPAMYEVGPEAYKHWFDGLGMLQNFKLENGKVTYCSRYLRSQAFVLAEQRRGIAYAEFGTPLPPDPCKNIFARFFSYFSPPERTDNCSISVVSMNGQTYASSDSPFLIGFDPSSLQALSEYNIRNDFPGPVRMFSMTPHPHEDEEGNIYNVAVSLKKGTRYNITQVPPRPQTPQDEGRAHHPLQDVKIVSTFVPKNRLCYYHSFAMTPNYFVFIENPFVVDVWALLTMKIRGRSFHECMKWDRGQPSRFYVIERMTGKVVAQFKTENFFSFHHVNAYESESDIIMDVCCYPDARIVHQYYLHHLRTRGEHEVSKGFPDAALRRYRLPIRPSESRRTWQTLPRFSDGRDYKVLYYGVELPQINYRFANGKPYRFMYGVGPHKHGDFLNQLIKVDVLGKEAKTWYQPDCYPSEPVFVAAPGAEAEDEGVIISSVVGVRGKKSFLLVLDGRTFREIARATVQCPMAHSLHGMFRPRSPALLGLCREAWA
ncbi:beta,beta-carotene 15,15'-dioxygenase-like isoform X2 [Acropora palmata]